MTALVHGRSPGKGPNGQPLPRVKLTDGIAAFERNRLAGCAQAALLLKQEISARRIGATGIRCALPLKKQQALLAANEGIAAQKLLKGESLAAIQ
jgi:hypothetical protein